MHYFKWLTAFLSLICGPAYAGDLLPVAFGHKSVPFVLDHTKVIPETGSTVAFFMEDEGGVPRKLNYTWGYVLGEEDNVLFIELKDDRVTSLVKKRASGKVIYRVEKAPDAQEVAARREISNGTLGFYLAPHMLTLTVELALKSEVVGNWSPGEQLTFYNAAKVPRYVRINGAKTETTPQFRDQTAIYSSSVEKQDGRYDVTIVTNLWTANALIQAELEGRLTVDDTPVPRQPTVSDETCYAITRRGTERTRISIACPD